MEVEERLLAAIDQLAQDGAVGEIRCLAALLACRGKVEQRSLGWQHPFRDYAEREGAACQQQLNGLAQRKIITNSAHAVTLNSHIMTYNKDIVTTRCANRLFARAHSKFAQVLREIPYKELLDLSRRASTVAENRAYRNLGNRYWELKRAGLLVSSNRTKPYLFPSLRWVEDVPFAAGVALTLEQGNALTWENCAKECGTAFHMAVATGALDYDSQAGTLALTPLGRELAATYTEKAVRRRLRWITACRDETMHFLVDELSAPMPAVWVDGTSAQVNRIWLRQESSPLRILFKERQLRMWLRRLVRRLEKAGLAQLISCRDGVNRYYFAPGAAQVAKAALELPAERFAPAPEMNAQCLAAYHLLAIVREADGVWRWRPDPATAPQDDIVRCMETALRKLKSRRVVNGPANDGAYGVPDPDAYRWAIVELLLDPVTEFLTTLPEPEPEAEEHPVVDCSP